MGPTLLEQKATAQARGVGLIHSQLRATGSVAAADRQEDRHSLHAIKAT